MSTHAHGQNKLLLLDSGRQTSLRGLCIVDNNTVWVSGSNGTVARTIDGGKSFKWIKVTVYEDRDFRDIEAFNKDTAIIMGIAEPAIILKTTDGGRSWYKVFEDSTKGMFLDAMDFDASGNGVVVGDPINKFLFRSYGADYGETWTVSAMIESDDSLQTGEAFFASSGTNVIYQHLDALYATGGLISRFKYKDHLYDLNMINGKQTTGANSIAMAPDKKNATIVGGDFKTDTSNLLNCVLVSLGRKPTFNQPARNPHGYRSCVAYLTNKKLITCGASGVDISLDGGNHWLLISKQSYHVCQKAKKGSAVFLAGANGKIARLL